MSSLLRGLLCLALVLLTGTGWSAGDTPRDPYQYFFNESFWNLTEELEIREDLTQLPLADYTHLAGDATRAYGLLVHEWLEYMKHLKDNYPYLFSLAMRTNPFDQEASPLVT